MSDTIEILKALHAIESRLESIQLLLAKTPLRELLVKPCFTCQEVARLSRTHGVQAYETFTLRLACSDGRVPEAEKRANRQWSIPVGAVQRILTEGLPPERRNGQRRDRTTRSY